MNALLSIALWLALIMLYCCGHVAGHEKEELTTDDYTKVTSTSGYEYDYTFIFDYSEFPEEEPYIRNKVSVINPLNLLLLLGLAVLQIWC